MADSSSVSAEGGRQRLLEHRRIEFDDGGVEAVAGSDSLDRVLVAAEQAAQAGDVHLHGLARLGLRALRPQRVGDVVDRDDVAGTGDEQPEHESLLRSAEGDDVRAGCQGDRPEHSDAHVGNGSERSPSATGRTVWSARSDLPRAVGADQLGEVAGALALDGGGQLAADRRGVLLALDAPEDAERRGRVVVVAQPGEGERQARVGPARRRGRGSRPRRRRRPRRGAAGRRRPSSRRAGARRRSGSARRGRARSSSRRAPACVVMSLNWPSLNTLQFW